jgi:hypothetical protein
MIEALLAAVESVDPQALPLWLVVAMSAAMYPLGFLFPCSAAVRSGGVCDCCCKRGQTLPDSVAIEFEGMSTIPVGPVGKLLSLSIQSCAGTGAVAEVSEVDDTGAITGVTLVDGGSGFAVNGRVAPAGLSVSGGSGASAEFQITLTAEQDDCNFPYWAIESVTVTEPGDGYADGDALAVSLGDNENEIEAATLTLRTAPGEPAITAEATTGFGAVLAVTTKQTATSPARWGVDAVQVTAAGSGFYGGDPVTFAAGSGTTEEQPATGTVRVRRTQPLSVVVDRVSCGGTGAVLAPVFNKLTYDSRDVWEVDAVIVQNGGANYSVGCNVYFRKSGPGTFEDQEAVFQVASIGAGGAIASLAKQVGGRYYSVTDEIEFIVVTNDGSYYGRSTTAESVTVDSGGRYYKTDFGAPALVSAATVALSQTGQSNGSGAEFSATVDDDTTSETFGQVVDIAIENGGAGYVLNGRGVLGVGGLNTQTGILNRHDLSNSNNEYFGDWCAFTSDQLWAGTLSRMVVLYRGSGTPPQVLTWGGSLESLVMTASGTVPCEGLTFTATSDEFDGTATVTAVLVEEE